MWWHDGSVNFVWVLLFTFEKPFQFLTEHHLLILFWGLYVLQSWFKILYLSDWIVWFQNGCNKEVIELLVMLQFWSEIVPVISNQICTKCLFDFEMMCLISVLIALPHFHYHNYFHHDYYLVFTQWHWDKIEWSSHSHWPLLDVYNHQHTSFDNNYLSSIDLTHSWYLYIFGVELNFRSKVVLWLPSQSPDVLCYGLWATHKGFLPENIVIIAGINEWKSSLCNLLSHCYSVLKQLFTYPSGSSLDPPLAT